MNMSPGRNLLFSPLRGGSFSTNGKLRENGVQWCDLTSPESRASDTRRQCLGGHALKPCWVCRGSSCKTPAPLLALPCKRGWPSSGGRAETVFSRAPSISRDTRPRSHLENQAERAHEGGVVGHGTFAYGPLIAAKSIVSRVWKFQHVRAWNQTVTCQQRFCRDHISIDRTAAASPSPVANALHASRKAQECGEETRAIAGFHVPTHKTREPSPRTRHSSGFARSAWPSLCSLPQALQELQMAQM